jgi:hypothetical protein
MIVASAIRAITAAMEFQRAYIFSLIFSKQKAFLTSKSWQNVNFPDPQQGQVGMGMK